MPDQLGSIGPVQLKLRTLEIIKPGCNEDVDESVLERDGGIIWKCSTDGGRLMGDREIKLRLTNLLYLVLFISIST